jgi:4-amino-4-deoxy-L-arabinose transferase-like glycosyltransferase
MKTVKKLVALVILITTGWVVLNYQLDRPYVGHHGMNGAQFGIMARNHLRYGLRATKLGQVESVDIVDPSQLKFNAHHPFLYPVMLAGSFRVFGESEWAARLLSVVLTILAAVMLYRLAGEIWNETVGLLAGVLWLLTPMVAHFGKMPVHEPVVMVFILLAINQYWLWWRWEARKHLVMSVVWGAVGGLIAWPAFYLMPVLVIHAWLTKPNLRLRSLGLLVAPVVVMAWHLVHTRWLTGSWLGGGLVGVFAGRILRRGVEETGVNLPVAMGLVEFVRLQFNWVRSYYTPGLLILAVVWLGVFGFMSMGGFRFKERAKEWLVVVLLVFGLAHVVVNPSGASNHEYMLYYLGPFMAVSGALVLGKLYGWLPGKWWMGLLVLVVGFVVWSGQRFLVPLEKAEFHQPGYELGAILEWELWSGEKAIIASTQFQSFFGHLVKYYSDRHVESGDFGPEMVESLRSEYKFIVVPESHPPRDEGLVSYLEERFWVNKRGEFWLYDLRSEK